MPAQLSTPVDPQQLNTNLNASFTGGTDPSVQPPLPQTNSPLAEEIALDVLDKVLTDVEQNRTAQVLAQAVVQPASQTQPQTIISQGAGPAAKESLTITPQEVGPSSTAGVEYEPNPEMPPDVESYLERVEQDPQQIPHEVVLSGQDFSVVPQKTMSQPVIVLPITPELEAEGKKQNPSFSVRWLVEWSQRIMKIFSGKVIYRQD